ncbi:energy transducer TonB [Candidatus Neomarinimicrobiota bacterium]
MKDKSIITSNYEGWIASILLHGLLSLIFVLVVYDNPIDISEYTDVTFSNYNPIDFPVIEENVLSPAPPSPIVASVPKKSQPTIVSKPRTDQTVAKSMAPTRKVDLPTRRMTEHDVDRIPIESQGQLTKSGQKDRISANREAIHGINDDLSSLDDEIFNNVKVGSKPSDKSVGKKVEAVAVPGQKGGEVKFDKPYEISWEGVVRDILYDPLPQYPEGFDKEARIRIKITVLPNGTIGDLIPLQKADATLESVTMKTLKLWRLSPLKPTDPQMNQTAVISFRFVLQ